MLPRYVLGAEPLTPGWTTARISPRIGDLAYAKGKVPTRLGPVHIDWENGNTFKLKLELPEGMKAKVDLPMIGTPDKVVLNGSGSYDADGDDLIF